MNGPTHTVGSHSDDRGGESDWPCYCDQSYVYAIIKVIEWRKMMSKNPDTCLHNILDNEDDEVFCTECGIVMEGYCQLCLQEMTANCNNGNCDE